MPELPEVEMVKRGLSRLLPGHVITNVSHDTEKTFPNSKSDVSSFMIGAQVMHVRRRAKVLIIELSTEYALVVHLKMTGQLVFVGSETRFGAGHPNDSLIGSLPDRSTRVTITFSDGSQLFFNDQRKFGWMRLLPSIAVEELDFFKRMGPEPLTDDFLPEEFIIRIRRRKGTTIKAALLDQSVIAGIGNIYADESLWGAKIHPATLVAAVSDRRLRVLYAAVREVLMLSISKGGSTDKNYVDAEGRKGSYLLFARVFRREGLPCPRCGSILIKIRVGGRGTHLCPHCQRLIKQRLQ